MPASNKTIGRVLQGTYRIHRLIGEGGMGAVYEASHTRVHKKFAVKLLNEKAAANAEALARFEREAMVTSALGHENILEVLDFNKTDDGTPYIIMELLHGEDLGTRIERSGRLPLAQVRSIFIQAADGLQAAHDSEVVHRDLKPQNLFLSRKGKKEDVVKIVDFGISKVLGGETKLTHTQVAMGTPCYMSPEQALEQSAEVDQRSDIFSMGSILYEMLSGRPPFVGDRIAKIMFSVAYQEARPLTELRLDVPPRWIKAVERAMAKKPAERFDTVDAFAAELADPVASDMTTQDLAPVIPDVVDRDPEAKESDTDEDPAPALAETLAGPGLVATGEQAAAAPGDAFPPIQHPPVDNPFQIQPAPAHPAATPQQAPHPVGLPAPAPVTASLPGHGTTLTSAATESIGHGAVRRKKATWAAAGAVLTILASVGLIVALQAGGDKDGPAAAPAAAAKATPSSAPDAATRVAALAPETAAAKAPVKAADAVPEPTRSATPKRREVKAATAPPVKPAREPARAKPSAPARVARAPRKRAAKPRRAASKRTERKRGTLQVMTLSRSSPIPAYVYVDGRRRGQAPLLVKGLTAGNHRIEARLAGYKTARKRGKVLAGRSNSVVLFLRKKR